MEVVFGIIVLVGGFILISYLLGSFVQLLSNLTGRRINIRSAAGWTSFKPKSKNANVPTDLELFNRQMEGVNLGMSPFDLELYSLTGYKEILKEYQLLPQKDRNQILKAIQTSPIKAGASQFEFPLHTPSIWLADYSILYLKLKKIDLESLPTLSPEHKENINIFINEYHLVLEKEKQMIDDILMLEINVKKVNNEFTVLLLPTNPIIKEVDVAFKDICLYLRSYPDKDKFVDIKKDGNFKLSVYSIQIGIAKHEPIVGDKPLNYVAFSCSGINFSEVKRMVKFAYHQMPPTFTSTFDYKIDFDSLTF